ncbi:MAG TPA: outer membrane lipoprotein carrier protein LolA [Bdellovibrionota bacterium]|nr:outer membrane lipoprotein carrier protein LolA [Bdellovibrionota bacterium]
MLALVGLMLLAAPAHAAERQPLPPLLQDVEKHYSTAATLKADFVQVNELAALNRTKESNGTIYFKRPDKLRWETKAPEPNLLVSDGKKFWFYTPPFDATEDGQVVIRKSSEVQTRLARALLSGAFSAARDMTIKPLEAGEFELIPKKGTAGSVLKCLIHIDGPSKLIDRLVLEHAGGNRSEIRLTGIELGKPLEKGLFSFTPPPHTETHRE